MERETPSCDLGRLKDYVEGFFFVLMNLTSRIREGTEATHGVEFIQR